MKYSLKQQINRLLIPIFITLAVVITVYSLMLLAINNRYEKAMLSADTAADFNKEFKETLDLAMYNHVIRPRSENPEEDLPMEELDKAEAVIHRLENTTTLPDNQWRIRSMLYMCQNLRMYMEEIARTESYDMRMELLEKNIRGETGLTTLIEEYMHDFVADEVQELSRLRDNLGKQSLLLVLGSFSLMTIIFLVIVFYSMKVTRRITEPLQSLTQKAAQFGIRDFSRATPIQTNIEEIQILDQSFNEMTGHITALMNKQIENERSLHQTELELLQAQINPHFLYNTLDSIAILAESNREEDVINMITSLSTFFRNSLSEGEDIHTIHAEFAQAESYLEIQQIRYSDILTYSIEVSDEIQDRLIPKLILQPLIENALYHGIKNRRGRGLITITGNLEGENIFLRVKDNGAGMSSEQLEQLQNGFYQEKKGSFGLWNVHQRIRLYCGRKYGLSFESAPGEGTTVTVTLPAGGIGSHEKREGNNEDINE
ncbi:MAG: sensor histidine kinase [Anaerolineaceae bacterium]|nr:sensor histidine kinase [Anaerolineaceae bacterium]